MSTNSIHTAFINALLADATYVDLLSPTGIPLVGDKLIDALSKRLTPDLAKYLSDHFEVVAQKLTDDNTQSGFDATVFKSKDDGQVYVSMRGSEGLGDFRNDGFLTLGGLATEQVIDMVNWWLREITPSTELARQIKWDPLHQPNPASIEIVPSFVEGTRVAGTGHLVGVTNVQVDGHSMGGHMASECFNSEASDESCLSFDAIAECLQEFAAKTIAYCAYFEWATGLFFTKTHAANDTSWRLSA